MATPKSAAKKSPPPKPAKKPAAKRSTTKKKKNTNEKMAAPKPSITRTATATATATTKKARKPTLRDAQRALTRERILDAATARFAGAGYASTTVDDIVAEADVGRATFYLHFGSRQEVMEALLQRVLPMVHGLYDDLLALPVIDLDALVGWVERFFAFYAANKGVLSASMQAETIDVSWSRQLEALSWKLVARFSPRDASKRGEAKQDQRQVRALILLEELDRVAYLLAVRGWKIERSAAASVLADHWLEFFTAAARRR